MLGCGMAICTGKSTVMLRTGCLPSKMRTTAVTNCFSLLTTPRNDINTQPHKGTQAATEVGVRATSDCLPLAFCCSMTYF
jgi:hypothetical protein